jgi:hypothetical protein
MRLTFSQDALHALLPFGTLTLKAGRPRFTPSPGYPDKEAASPYAAEEPFAFLPDGTDAVKLLGETLGEVDDVCVLGDGRVVAVRREGKGARVRALLGIGELSAERGIETSIPLVVPSKPVLATWPAGTIWAPETPPPYSRKKSLADPHGRMRLGASEEGVAVAQYISGLVAVIRAGADGVGFVLRLPAQEEARLFATPTAEGVLAAIVVEGRESALLHLTERGELLGRLEGFGFTPPVRLGQGRVLVFDGARGEFLLLSLPGLEVVAQASAGLEAIDLAAADDGVRFAAADPTTIQTGRLEGDELAIDPPVELSVLANPARAAAAAAAAARAQPTVSRYRPRRASGPPAIGFPSANVPLPRWEFVPSAPVRIEVAIRSAGGAGRGVRVELSGPALESGLVVAERAVLAGEAVPFEPPQGAAAAVRAATFPEVTLPEGYHLPLDPPPKSDLEKGEADLALEETHLPLRLELARGRPSGSELLTLTVRPLSGSTSPLKWTRPLTLK